MSTVAYISAMTWISRISRLTKSLLKSPQTQNTLSAKAQKILSKIHDFCALKLILILSQALLVEMLLQ